MKKLLLSTSALVVLMSASALAGEAMKVNLQGSLDVQAATRDVKSKYVLLNNNNNNVSNLKKIAFNTEAELGIGAIGKLENGLSYGGRIGIQTNTGQNKKSARTRLDQSYVFVETDMLGRVEVGSNFNAETTMKVDASSIAVASGGAMGTWNTYSGVNIQGFDFLPNVITVNGNRKEGTRQITYYSPTASGIKFGLSYIPDSTNVGENQGVKGKLDAMDNSIGLKDQVVAGVHYTNQFDEVTLSGSVIGQVASAKRLFDTGVIDANTKLKGLRKWAVGAQIDYAGVSLVGAYGSLGNSYRATNLTNNTQEEKSKKSYWSTGVRYTQGPIAASLTYVDAKNGATKLQVVSLGSEYKVAEGFVPYLQVDWFSNKDKANLSSVGDKQKGTVYAVGTRLQF
jgi:hypothetical protein